MTLRLIDFFDPLFEHVSFDKKKARAFQEFQIGFINKNEEHLNFFSGNLLGVQRVIFSTSDALRLFEDVIGVAQEKIKQAIAQDKNFNLDHIVASDSVNLALFYCAHRFLKSSALDPKARYEAALNSLLIFHYRVLSSLITHYFRYPADPKTAQATYTQLSARYLIKSLGSWIEVLNYRCNEILKEESIHHDYLKTFQDDGKIMYMVSDSQGRMRDMIKNIYAEFMRVHTEGDRVHNTTLNEITLDGQETITDKTKGPQIYTHYVLSILPDPYSFIKEELFAVILQVMPAVSGKMLKQTLTYLVEQIHGKDRTNVEHFINQVMTYSIEYLNRQGHHVGYTKDIQQMLSDVRNLYLSSRASDHYLKEIRELGESIVKKVFPNVGPTQNAAIRTSVILYVLLRAFTKHYYHQ
jgi:hypothetical protein